MEVIATEASKKPFAARGGVHDRRRKRQVAKCIRWRTPKRLRLSSHLALNSGSSPRQKRKPALPWSCRQVGQPHSRRRVRPAVSKSLDSYELVGSRFGSGLLRWLLLPKNPSHVIYVPNMGGYLLCLVRTGDNRPPAPRFHRSKRPRASLAQRVVKRSPAVRTLSAGGENAVRWPRRRRGTPLSPDPISAGAPVRGRC